MGKGRVLLIHPGGIGDLLLALPAIRSLRRRYGMKQLALVASQAIGEVLVQCREAARLFPLESRSLSDLLSGTVGPASPLAEWLGACDLVVGWMSDPGGMLKESLTDRGVKNVIIESPFANSLHSVHQSDRIVETLRDLHLDRISKHPLKLPQAVMRAARLKLKITGVPDNRPYVVIHPGSGSPHKCSHPTRIMAVVDWAREQEYVPVFIEGPADSEMMCRLRASCLQRVPVLQGLELTVVAGVLKGATLYVGHDSGVTHLASALNVPSVACFGPTDEARWAPRGEHVTVMRGTACDCPSWEAVQRCSGQPCLAIPVEELIHVCTTATL